VLGSAPLEIVPLTFAFATEYKDHPERFTAAMLSLAAGLLADAGFLFPWRYIPVWFDPKESEPKDLFWIIMITFGGWFVIGCPLVFVLQLVENNFYILLALACAGISASLALGIWSCWYSCPSPPEERPTSWPLLLLDSVFAGAMTYLGAWIGCFSETTGAIVSGFPVIYAGMLWYLWIQKDETLIRDAVGPTILGSTAFGLYAISCGLLMPVIGVAYSVVVGLLLACLLGSFPAFMFVRWRQYCYFEATVEECESIVIPDKDYANYQSVVVHLIK